MATKYELGLGDEVWLRVMSELRPPHAASAHAQLFMELVLNCLLLAGITCLLRILVGQAWLSCACEAPAGVL